MNWTRGQLIGHGGSASVFLASSCPTPANVFAVKSVELPQSESLQKEQQILSSLTSPHIVGYRGFDVTRETNGLMYNLFMDYAPGGSLADAIRHRAGRPLDESLIGFYTRQLVQGLQFIHSKGLVHCDIKARNILISQDGAKIADFGCAKWVSRAATVPIGGTPLFMAPEVARGDEQEFPSDIWALGCTIIEMATGGRSPWPEVSDPVSALYRIGYSIELPETPSYLSDQAKDFLEKCLRRNPNERWTANQLLNHPFLGEFNSNPKQIQQVYSDSPTSILDQGIWSSTEEITTQSKGNNGIQTSPKTLPAEQIRRLSKVSGKPNWRDGNWITIRRHENGKSKEVGGGDDEEDEADMIGGSEKVSSNYDENERQSGSGGKEWLEFLGKNVSCNRISRNHLADHSFRNINLVQHHHSNLSFHTHLANFVSLMPSIL